MRQADLFCQRWTGRREHRRPAGEVIDVSRYEVEPIKERAARAFVTEHHYSGTYPAARARYGLLHRGRLVGVAVFSVPIQPAAGPRWCGVAEVAELGRFVLLDEVPANGETWMLARAFRLLREDKPDLRAVLSYSDPVERWADGVLVKPGHVGTIYQAHNGRFLGRSSPRTLWLTAAGTILSPRTRSKLRNGERGAAYAGAQLAEAGAPERRAGEDGHAYLARALASGRFRRMRHTGNLVYAWALSRDAQLAPALPYVKAG